ncbi:MAG: hypothetical protein ACKVI6_02710 [Candidatus Poseidoniales archaeon]|tara:strand:- start:832 stop:1995 length:1164 start_codon:yes stop_codon:yes gene_type:complete
MEDEISQIDSHISTPKEIRLSQIKLEYKLSEINSNFHLLDDIRRGLIFQATLIRHKWGIKELTIIMLGVLAFTMGSWDIGIGELSQGGDYNRFGIFGENSGFLQVSDWTLMLSLLSVICWLGIIISLWSEYPIMRENIIYILIGTFAVQYGYMASHASNPSFPFNSKLSDLGGVLIGNIILFFLAIIVVHRAVKETRDIHVQERHAHPDPRVVEKSWEDHSLKAWDLEMGILIFAINVMSWSGSHAVASRMNMQSESLNYLLILLYVLSGVISVLMLLVIIWFPHFMLGSAEDRIQSVRAREVAGENIDIQPKVEQGLCPICNIETTAKKFASGKIEVPCSEIDCKGKGMIGNECDECGEKLPTRLKCRSCNSNTPIDSHFGDHDTW